MQSFSEAETLIQHNYACVIERMRRAAAAAGRNPQAIRLMVVTKGHALPAIRAAIQAGAADLGENYVEEGLAKVQALADMPGLRWHMIGHVQSRKAQQVSQYFDVVHSVDSLKLAQRLDRFAGEVGRKVSILLECNVSGEASKFGWQAWIEDEWPGLCRQIEPLLVLPHLRLQGLMTMAPFFDDPELARPSFARLRRLSQFLAGEFPDFCWEELSMGMSADFEVAIQEGATLVRVGTAILGERLAH